MQQSIKKFIQKKTAFTFAELLIVVVLIASLTVVAIPQYKRMLEARKVGEAEAVLSAVRVEQERRCAAGKRYATISELSDLIPSMESDNFYYLDGADGQSLQAQSKGTYDYTLKLASYRDGRICCSAGADCSRFNYPLCSALTGVNTAAECTQDETDATAYSPGACDVSITKETGSCGTYGGAYTSGGNKATRTKLVKNDCSITYSDWDKSECYTSKSGSCPCSEYGGGFDTGTATCSYTEYGDTHTANWTVTNRNTCYKANQTESCACSTYGGTYNTGTATCSFNLYYPSSKQNYAARDTSTCYKEVKTEYSEACGADNSSTGGTQTIERSCKTYPTSSVAVCSESVKSGSCYHLSWQVTGNSTGGGSCSGQTLYQVLSASCTGWNTEGHESLTHFSANSLSEGQALVQGTECWRAHENQTCSFSFCTSASTYRTVSFKCCKDGTCS